MKSPSWAKWGTQMKSNTCYIHLQQDLTALTLPPDSSKLRPALCPSPCLLLLHCQPCTFP